MAFSKPPSTDGFAKLLVRMSLGFLLVVVLAAVFLPEFYPEHLRSESEHQFAPPSGDFVMGADLHGRDLSYRLLQGARISLLVGVAGAMVSLVIGTLYGLIAGYFGGRVDAVMMRFVDLFYAIPRLIFIIILINFLEEPVAAWMTDAWRDTPLYPLRNYSKIFLMILALGCIEWLILARLVRAQVLSLKQRLFVDASRALGQSHFGILMKHLLPNLRGLILVYLGLTIPTVMIDEAFISFIGLGLDASQASWGVLLRDGAQALNPIESCWWLLVFPAGFMSLTLLALNFIADSLQESRGGRGAS
ncbi:MAG: ABC transporter permease [Verrucomicrobiales bacterium]